MGIKSKRLETLETRLKAVLQTAATDLAEAFPEGDIRTWGHELGRANDIHGYCAGLECRGVALSVVLFDLHLFPIVKARMLGPTGGYYEGAGFRGGSLDCLSELPSLIEFYRGCLERNQQEKCSDPIGLAAQPPLTVMPAPPEELDFLEQILPDLVRTRGLENWVLSARTSSPRQTEDWTAVSLPQLRQQLPALKLETLRSLYQPEAETDLGGLESVALFSSSESRSELRWSDFYGQYPDAMGLLEISRSSFDRQGTQALIRIRCAKGFSKGVTAGVQPSWEGGYLTDGLAQELLMFEKRATWRIAGSWDLNQPIPLAMLEELERRWAAPDVDTPENAARLAVDQVRLDKVWLSRSGHRRRIDLTVTKGGRNREVGVAEPFWLSEILERQPVVIDRPLITVRSLNLADIWEPLGEFLGDVW